MKALVFQGVGKVSLEDVPKPKIEGPEDAIVRITVASICGSDLHILHGLNRLEPGTIIGHEFTGVVEEVGSAVTKVKPGDRVLGAAGVSCGHCKACRKGLLSMCENFGIYGCGPRNGNLQGVQAEYARVLYANESLEKIPEGLTEEQVLFAGDILSTAYMGVSGVKPDSKGIQPGSVVAIFGAGPVGLCAVAVARLYGAAQIIAVDMEDYRLSMATRLGADKVINFTKENPVETIKKMTDGWGADLVIEAVGSAEALTSCLAAVAPGGDVNLIGVISLPTPISFIKLLNKNINIQTGMGNTPPKKLINLIQAGRLDLTPLITHRFPLAEAVKAYEMFDKREDGVIKVLLIP